MQARADLHSMIYTNPLEAINVAVQAAAPGLEDFGEIDFMETLLVGRQGLLIRLTVFVKVDGELRLGVADNRKAFE